MTLAGALVGCHAQAAQPKTLSNVSAVRTGTAVVGTAAACEISGPNIVGNDHDNDGRADSYLRYDLQDPSGMKIRVLTCGSLDLERDGRTQWLATKGAASGTH
ncbi:MAG: hypothetical protein H0T46_02145 [Deltaproteobacteria bacterium]|nr:hypothetical protein [Deltaproteobacteria bacterium]